MRESVRISKRWPMILVRLIFASSYPAAEVKPIGPPDQLAIAVAYERILLATIERRLLELAPYQRRRSARVPLAPCLPGFKPAGARPRARLRYASTKLLPIGRHADLLAKVLSDALNEAVKGS